VCSSDLSDPNEDTVADGLARLGAAVAALQAVIDAMSPAALSFLEETSVTALRNHLEALWTSAPNVPIAYGRVVLVAGTATVSAPTITTADTVLVSRQIAGGSPGNLTVSIINATSFTITSDDAGDTSDVAYAVWA
jgi:hypothetical protein